MQEPRLTAMPRHIDDLGPDFERRWRDAPREQRRALVAELRDLYLMLEEKDELLLRRLRGQEPAASHAEFDDLPVLEPTASADLRQPGLFDEPVAPAPQHPSRENPFLPRSVLDRLQQSRDRASAGLRDLLQTTADDLRPPAPPGTATQARLDDLERELRLKLGPVVETLIEAHMDQIKSELRVRLRLEMDRLIAEHLRR